MTARHPKLATLNKAAEGVGKLADGKKGVISNATKFVYALPDDASIEDLWHTEPHDVWYVGGITDENAREVTVKLDFLKPGVTYEATIYADADNADGIPGESYNPQAYTITRQKVTAKSKLKIKMARCGGFAVSLRSL